jgi:hypothetical protein
MLLRRKIDEELADSMLLLKLRSRFEDKFRYDEQGLPKVWKPEDDIDAYFKKARDDVSVLKCDESLLLDITTNTVLSRLLL